jgi:hypothetical protein
MDELAKEEMREKMNEIIDIFVLKYRNGPVQGSEEWKKKRCKTIGGSEIAKLINSRSPFAGSNMKELGLSKIGHKNFSGSIQTRWGNLFEDLNAKYFDYLYKTTTKGDQIFIADVHKNQSYSPDGIAVIDFETDVTVFEFAQDGQINGAHIELQLVPTIALIEFKSPWSRIPDGSIPDDYLCQVLAGLDTVKICSLGVYCESVFRSCSVPDYGFNNMINRKIHTKDGDIWDLHIPVAIGFILFYADGSINEIDHSDGGSGRSTMSIDNKYIINKAEARHVEHLKDYGDVSQYELGELFSTWHVCKKLQVVYSEMFMGENNESNDGSNKESKNEHCIDAEFKKLAGGLPTTSYIYGILPYKLMLVDTHVVNKQRGYIAKHQESIDSFMKVINMCNELPYEERKKKYEEIVNPRKVFNSDFDDGYS